MAVGAAADQDHGDHGEAVGNRGEKADGQVVLDAGRLDHGRQPEAHTVQADDEREVDQAHGPHLAVAEDLAQGDVALGGDVGLDIAFQQRLFLVIQPLGVVDAVVQIEEGDDADEDGGNRFQKEHPLPAGNAVRAAEVFQNPPRHRAAYESGERHGRHEPGRDVAAPPGGIPVGEVQDDARKESGLGHAQQEAHDVEHRRRGHEHRRPPPRGGAPPLVGGRRRGAAAYRSGGGGGRARVNRRSGRSSLWRISGGQRLAYPNGRAPTGGRRPPRVGAWPLPISPRGRRVPKPRRTPVAGVSGPAPAGGPPPGRRPPSGLATAALG
ncbi:hypothetical protein CDEF62S_00388 [Castellaniella defragrans]